MSHRNKQNEPETEKNNLVEINSKLEEITEKLAKIELKVSSQRLKQTKNRQRKRKTDSFHRIPLETIKKQLLLHYKNKIIFILGFICALYILPQHIIRTDL